jgi:hypothetical protein
MQTPPPSPRAAGANAAKTLAIAAGVVVGLIILTALFVSSAGNFARYRQEAANRASEPAPEAPGAPEPGPGDATYRIGERAIALKGGVSADFALRLFAVEAEGDLDGDGDLDGAVLLTYDGGGSGTFFYLAAALLENGRYEGTNALLIGDRVAPQSTTIDGATILHSYATTYPWEPFTARPSVGKTKRAVLEGGILADVPGPVLTVEEAHAAVAAAWGDCPERECRSLLVEPIDGVDGVWYVRVIYDGLPDDSVRASQTYAAMHHADGEWTVGAVLSETWQCHEGRGHQDFTDEPCV